MRASRRKYFPNLFYRNIKDPQTGIVYRIKVSAAGLRTLKKKGII
jgi:ribosomal protein L28